MKNDAIAVKTPRGLELVDPTWLDEPTLVIGRAELAKLNSQVKEQRRHSQVIIKWVLERPTLRMVVREAETLDRR